MDKVKRVLVYIVKDQAAPQRVQFLQSVTGFFSDGEDQVDVSFSLEDSRFLVSRGAGGPGPGTPLKRPSFCPIKHLSAAEDVPLDVQQRGVDVGVAILLQTANQRVLLTRRAQQLHIFPNVWVPPGGHVEPEETLLAAGLRELQEETGLHLRPDQVSPQVLGLWESVFPHMLSRGRPQRHHIVVYMLLLSSLSHLQLQPSLKPCPAEVSASVWVDRRLAAAIVSSMDGEEGDVCVDELPSRVSVTQVSADSALTQALLPTHVFTRTAPVSGPDVERVSTGTKYALKLWLRSLETPELRPQTSDL
ncbi:nucleoside diphosphate-linked moiety X motif 17 [Austrofundulus limnaeus]|uniref:m7GpppN-mRNA hydrolase NUDT17 n=1 Tax=Austrofundulus limnaeus TaxID=52670 RepID=A0A2I4CCD9_AUSLI|nr:PREDICTED: nucleoside diphosphate-linked moiety X motif 17 [Austrofundulus limnaeus]